METSDVGAKEAHTSQQAVEFNNRRDITLFSMSFLSLLLIHRICANGWEKKKKKENEVRQNSEGENTKKFWCLLVNSYTEQKQ